MPSDATKARQGGNRAVGILGDQPVKHLIGQRGHALAQAFQAHLVTSWLYTARKECERPGDVADIAVKAAAEYLQEKSAENSVATDKALNKCIARLPVTFTGKDLISCMAEDIGW
ncbi:hypothetical protein M3484_18815 [Pseudomonas sp. GX19020]|uniref:hypothetical protein n=1 Tax=Pseudomonas sp. GX19020 TaxID=2942277 RepID=UPI0020196A3F|nr:hypothetical protein [Pseudomonas sp. GX19020]MCL4068621.1 hypothetical protein [Pseudomonas sp. GX19020]